MVVDLGDVEADRIFHALADATRRDIMRRVILREQSVSSLATHYVMSFAAVQKHVAVLERAALVAKERRGREQIVQARVATVRRAARLLDTYAEIWAQRASGIERLLATDEKGNRS